MITVHELLAKHTKQLKLELIAGENGLSKKIKQPEIERPGLPLAGYLKGYSSKRILVFGKVEMEYIRDLDQKLARERLEGVLVASVPAVVIARRYRPPKVIIDLCNTLNIPLFRSPAITMQFLASLTLILEDELAPQISVHGTFVEAFGMGVMIQGESSIGKSETALGLIERGHRLVSDDVVLLKKNADQHLVGSGPDLTRHLLEIRGIGIINVAHLYGAVCVSESKKLDLVVELEEWDHLHFYDRVGLENKHRSLLDIKVPLYTIPVKPGRDVVSLVETIALNQRLKKMGYNSAKEFNVKLVEEIERKQKNNHLQEAMNQFSVLKS